MDDVADRDGGHGPRVTKCDSCGLRSALGVREQQFLWATSSSGVSILAFDNLLDYEALQLIAEMSQGAMFG